MTGFSIYLARCMPKALAKLLHGYGLNVTTTADAKMNGAKDHAHLNLTRYQRRLKMGDPHPGMLVCLEETTNEEILGFIQNLPAMASELHPAHGLPPKRAFLAASRS